MSKIGDIIIDKYEELKYRFMERETIRKIRSHIGNVPIMANELSKVGYDDDLIKEWKDIKDEVFQYTEESQKEQKKIELSQKSIERAERIIDSKGANERKSSVKKGYYYYNGGYYRTRGGLVRAAKRNARNQLKAMRINEEDLKNINHQLNKLNRRLASKEKEIKEVWRANNHKIMLMNYYEEHEETIKRMYEKNKESDNLETLIETLKRKECREGFEQSKLKAIRKRIEEDLEAFKKGEKVNGLKEYMGNLPQVPSSNDQNTGHSDQAPQIQDPQTQDSQTQDSQTQDSQTQDPQTQDSQTQDPQTQDSQTQKPQAQEPQDKRNNFKQGLKSYFGNSGINQDDVIKSMEDSKIKEELKNAGYTYKEIHSINNAEQIAEIIAIEEYKSICKAGLKSKKTEEMGKHIEESREYRIQYGIDILQKSIHGEKVYSSIANRLGKDVKRLSDERGNNSTNQPQSIVKT